MSDRHITEAVAEETVPRCPFCESTDLIVVYRAEVTQRAGRIDRDEDGDWKVGEYDSYQTTDGTYTDCHLECVDCMRTVAREIATDTFRMVDAKITHRHARGPIMEVPAALLVHDHKGGDKPHGHGYLRWAGMEGAQSDPTHATA